MTVFTISLLLEDFMKNKYVAYAFVGIKCAVAFLIAKAGYEMFRKIEKKPLPIITFIAMFGVSIALELLSKSISSIIFIIIGGTIGIAVYSLIGFGNDKKVENTNKKKLKSKGENK